VGQQSGALPLSHHSSHKVGSMVAERLKICLTSGHVEFHLCEVSGAILYILPAARLGLKDN
jgi:hypothetical protein